MAPLPHRIRPLSAVCADCGGIEGRGAEMRKIKCDEKFKVNGNVECLHQRKIISGLGGCLCKKENCYKLRLKKEK
jgi:hypothetical protein